MRRTTETNHPPGIGTGLSCVVVALALLAGLPLRAEGTGGKVPIGFRKGAVFAEFGLAATTDVSGAVSYFEEDRFLLRNRYLLLTATNNEARALALYSAEVRPTPKVRAIQGRLGFEYALTSRFGMGYSLESISVHVDNVPVTSAFRLAPWLLDTFAWTTRGAAPGGWDLYNAAVTSVHVARITSAAVEVTVHGAFGRIDPYLRFALGVSGFGSVTMRYGSALGVRFYFPGGFYVFGEGAADVFVVNYGGTGGGGGSEDSDDGGGGEGGIVRSPGRMRAGGLASGIETRTLSVRVSRLSSRVLRVGVGFAY